MRGTFSIELLNQKKDQNHKQRSLCFSETDPKTANSRVSRGGIFSICDGDILNL